MSTQYTDRITRNLNQTKKNEVSFDTGLQPSLQKPLHNSKENKNYSPIKVGMSLCVMRIKTHGKRYNTANTISYHCERTMLLSGSLSYAPNAIQSSLSVCSEA